MMARENESEIASPACTAWVRSRHEGHSDTEDIVREHATLRALAVEGRAVTVSITKNPKSVI